MGLDIISVFSILIENLEKNSIIKKKKRKQVINNMDILEKEIYVVYGTENIAGEAMQVIEKVFRNKENVKKYCEEHKDKNCSYDVWELDD